jgi:hypothetical protein
MYNKDVINKCQKITEYLSTGKKIALFGCGKIGTEFYEVLKKYDIFDAFVDNDENKQKNGYNDEVVWSLSEYLSKHPQVYIVITVGKEKLVEIEEELKRYGLTQERDFIFIDDFLSDIFPYVSYHLYHKLFVGLAQICVTERCTLKCKKCAHACNLVPHDKEDMLIDEVKKSADCFFSNVDIINEFVLIGGEPLLYKNLDEAIEYIGSRYRDKMIRFCITTNGTVMPGDGLLQLLKKYNMTLRVSDYSSSIPNLRKTYEALYKKLEGYSIIIQDSAIGFWFDYGFGQVNNGWDESILRKVFSTCKTPCREIRGEKYYYCVMARSVSENMGLNIGLDEYYDLSGNVNKEELLAFEMGYIKKGYLSMCRICRGADSWNHQIPIAEQQKREPKL